MQPYMVSSQLFLASTLILLGAASNNLFAAEQAVAPARVYNPVATERLLEILNYEKFTYYSVRDEIKDLIRYKNADLNAMMIGRRGPSGYITPTAFGLSIDCNDLEVMKFCLKRGANLNNCGTISYSKNGDSRTYYHSRAHSLHIAQSTQAAQMLIAAGATFPKDILAHAIVSLKSASLLAFFCNAGADINNQKDTFERLDDCGLDGRDDELIKKTAILLWFNAVHKDSEPAWVIVERGDKKQTLTKKNYREWEKQLDLLKEAVPATKSARLENLFVPHIAKDLVPVIREYMGPLHIPWDDFCFAEIERRTKQAEIAKQAAARKLIKETTNECSTCSVS